MATETQKQASVVRTIWPFLTVWRRRSLVGFLLGAVLGFCSPSVKQMAPKLGENTLKIVNVYLGPITVWPKHGKATILAILSLAALLTAFVSSRSL